jgi:hypothetical protein
MNTIEFEVHNQTLIRVDSKELINRNKNTYKAIFTFDEDSEWLDLNKFVIFTDGWGNTTTQHIGKSSNVLSCLIPNSVLRGSYFKVTVYAGDLVTTNSLTISLIQSGYHRPPPHSHHHHHHHPYGFDCDGDYTGRDIFVEIFDQLDESVDSIIYDNKTLYLFHRERVLDSIYLPFLTDDEITELVTNLTNEFILNLPLASSDNDGLMSSEDKVKLDSIEEGANHIIVDSVLDDESDNPVANRVVTSELNDLNSQLSNLNDLSDIVDGHTVDISGLVEELESIRVGLDGKEDIYDYVERLDNVIVDLLNQGE